MEIKKPAMAGTLESSDCQVTVEPGNGSVDCTMKARVEGAVFRSLDQIKDIPWGGAVR